MKPLPARAGSPSPARAAGLLALLALLAAGGAGRAQTPAADWRTLATPHFRLHYPAPAEAWTRQAAARLEAIRERVAAEVGYAPPEVVDVLIEDPKATANGLAVPTLGSPRLVLWTTPPLAESELGQFTLWSDLLLIHEETHLAHLLRPSRNPALRRLSKLVPVGPIPLRAPRWAIEGYATLVEGRLTGAGRPHSAARAAILRRWAQGGKLPAYAQLASDGQSWRGLSMAYLLGSAYLEWLEERGGPGSLRDLWARLTARQLRTFDQAFRGVFGESPADLYDRFRAELTWRALEAERLRAAPAAPDLPQDDLWQDLTWTTGAPALSRDGRKLAIVLRSRTQPGRLVVWGTGEPGGREAEERKEREAEAAERARERDPQDVPARRTKPAARKALHTWTPPDGIDPASPRFLPDGESVLFVRLEPDGEGTLHSDLSVWRLADGRVRRLTRGADLRDPDPSPDGRWAIAARLRHGLSQLVRVDLGSGAVEPVTEASVEVIYDRPRLSPEGTRVAYAAHREGRWRIEVLDLATGARRTVSPEGAGTAHSPAWAGDGRSIYAVLERGGYLDVYRLPPPPSGEGGEGEAPEPEALTRVQGAAFAPAPAPDGSSLFYLALEPDGLDLRRLRLPRKGGAVSAPGAPGTAQPLPPIPPPPPAREGPDPTVSRLAPALPPGRPADAPPLPPLAAAEVGASRPYGLGRQEPQWLAGANASTGGTGWEVGARSGDVLGRLDLLALAAFSSAGAGGPPEGGALAGAYRGRPVELRFHLFDLSERGDRDLGSGGPLRTERRGLEAGAAWERRGAAGELDLTAGLLWNEVREEGADVEGGRSRRDLRQRLVSFTGSYRRSRYLGRLGSLRQTWVDGAAGFQLAAGKTGDAPAWQRYGAGLAGGIRAAQGRLTLSWRRDGGRELRESVDFYRLGGPAASILPPSLLAQRRAAPGLPLDLWLGNRVEEQRLELQPAQLPAPLFYSRTRLWNGGERPGDWLALAGIELTLRIEPQPIARLPAFTLRAGLAQVVSAPPALGPLDGDWRWWIATAWRP